MIELITLYIPVVIICRNLSADSCEMIRYQGYFHSQKQCFDHIDISVRSRLVPGDHGRIHIDAWCVDIEIPGIDKKYIPKRT